MGRSCSSDSRRPRSRASARRRLRTSRRSATPSWGRAATSPTEPTCTSRTCSRTWRPGTRSSTFRSAWIRPSGRGWPRRRRRRTVAQGVREAQTERHVRRDYARHRRIGHAGSIQPASRLDRDVIGPDGTRYPRGTAVPQRADFNTLDNPFFWSADRIATRSRRNLLPACTSSSSTRRATTSVVPGSRWTVFCPGGPLVVRDGKPRPGLQLDPGDDASAELPRSPRAHRSFPLSELPE